jgi:hypothetical protein
MIDSNRKEDLSESYMEAIAAINGIAMTRNRRDENGIDVFLSRDIVREDGVEIGVTVEFQLKSTSLELRHNRKSLISYDLKSKNYRDLKRESTNQRFLALLVLPNVEQEWLTCNAQELIMRKCMYYKSLKDLPEKTNKGKTVVHFDAKNDLLTPESLLKLMQKVAEEE